jgi:uncharacterized protein (DUF924 family)
MSKPDDVLSFWLGAPAPDSDAFMAKVKRWFYVDKALDAEIRTRFGDTLTKARDGALDDWAATPRGRLGLIVVLDQFTRNLHRGTPRAFENDARGLVLAEAGIDAREDEALPFEEKMFLYMPLAHSEDVTRQERHVALVEAAVNAAPEALQGAYASFSKHARMYLEQIRRFGRFPHRNMILGRTCTQEEMAFLDSPSTNG